jgi:hypothetical protein
VVRQRVPRRRAAKPLQALLLAMRGRLLGRPLAAGHRHVPDGEGFAEFMHDGGFHRLGHGPILMRFSV